MAGPPCAAAPRADTITARGPPPMSGAAPARERPGPPTVPARGSPRQRQQGSGAARGGAQRPGHGCRFQNVSPPRRGAMTGVGGALGRRGRGGLEDSTAPRNVCGRIDGAYGRDTVWHGRGHCGGRNHISCGRDQIGCGRGLWRAGRAGRFRGGWAGERARLGRCRAAMDSRKLSELRAFVRLCKQNPGLLHTPELAFLREWVERSVPGRGRRRP